MEVAADFGENVTLTGGLVLQTLETWQSFIHTSGVTLKSNSGELYFETEDIDAFYKHLKSFDILYVHKLHEHPWGQRVVCFYDPDGHIIEAAEKLDAVIARFVAQGLSPKETADNDLTDCLKKLELVDEAYRKLLTDEARELLDSAGCEDVEVTWGSDPVEPVETIMQAAGLRG